MRVDDKDLLESRTFVPRHIGPNRTDVDEMLSALGFDSLDDLVEVTIPADIRLRRPLDLPPARTESQVLTELERIASRNRVFRSYIGMGYCDCITPPVIQRNILENPGWYTAYTPYQAEVAQGRLEALLNFQTVVIDLTGLPIANASLLDEATAAAEAMAMSYAVKGGDDRNTFFVSSACHPQTIDVVQTRAEARGIDVVVGDHRQVDFGHSVFGVLLQYPASDGRIEDLREVCAAAREAGALVTMATDLLALTLLTPPGELGADIAVGNSQRFGVPLGYGGPHAAFFSTREEYKRMIPGRIIGVSRDRRGRPALRMALQTREQHIRREKATSNICTAQVLLAVVASMYAVYHGPGGLRWIGERVHQQATKLAAGLRRLGHTVVHDSFFDTLCVEPDGGAPALMKRARDAEINLRPIDESTVGIALDETVDDEDLTNLLELLGAKTEDDLASGDPQGTAIPDSVRRTTPYLEHPVFSSHHSETEMLRYMRRLESRDLSLTTSMIPLGSCTMKLNGTAEMVPVTWARFARLHPFAPREQTEGYQHLFTQLETQLQEICGFDAVSLQPNAGSQGEFSGLLAIKRYHASRGESERDLCLIPQSAHGTNPASAVMSGMRVVVVRTDEEGNIDVADLRAKAEANSDRLAALMVTYPSTHGVFETSIREICEIVHAHGGQVYLDGANMNAQVGLCRPGDFGADVCHLNLHKTFCIPHGGGGPGMGPIAVAEHLAPFLPGHPVVPLGGEESQSVSAAPWGSPSILPISWVYIELMGAAGLTLASKVAILNANYVASRLAEDFPVLYRGAAGTVAHECIIDTRSLRAQAGIDVEDIAKRLTDFGFHAPTVSFPVPGTLMIEPTESESKEELDRFCDAMIAIRKEARAVELGMMPRDDNPLKGAPHTAEEVVATEWKHPYSRETGAFPAPWTREYKFWPAVSRVEAAYGDRNLICSCVPIEEYEEIGEVGDEHLL
ncbi:MAG: aminomethyl-transferring glycine dehydrogenase [Gemmatimonas sp.]|nr:aminomethyl-transferring glycine dehydrogenase [Gemmatimonas sp.]